MRRFLILVALAVLAMCMAVGCIREAKTYTTYTAPEQVINVGINEEFVIALDFEYLTIGSSDHDWRVSYYDTTMLKLVGSELELSKENEPGAVGTKWFKFKALTTGETKITMVYVLIYRGDFPYEEQLYKQIFTVNIK